MSASIRRRLLVILISTTLIAWLVVSIVSVARTRAGVEELFDAKLAQSAWVLLSLIGHELQEEVAQNASGKFPSERARLEEVATHLGLHKLQSPVAFQIWLRDGSFRFHSVSAPGEALSVHDNGFSDITLDGVTWRVFTHTDRSDIVVRFAERHEVREQLVNQLVRSVDRATHLLGQLLTLARVEPEAAAAVFEDVALDMLLRDVGAELAADAVRKHIDLSVDALPARVRGNAYALRVLVRNLVDNATLYARRWARRG
jgi:signal transduction histidine kinase